MTNSPDPPGGVVDAAVHVASADTVKYPRPQDFPAAPQFSAPIEDFESATGPHGVTQSVLVQPSQYGFDHSYLCDSLLPRSGQCVGVALIDPESPKGPDLLEALTNRAAITGLRLGPNYSDGRQWLGSRSDPLVSRAAALKLVVSLFVAPHHLGSVEVWLEKHPDVTVVIDHLGRPDLADGEPLEAVRALGRLARFPGLFVKISALPSLSREDFPHRDVWQWAEELIEAFGADRLMWGSDYPLTAAGPAYGHSMDVIAGVTAQLSGPERDRLLGGTARHVYRLP